MGLVGYVSNFADNDLVDTNIKDGVEIFGVEGTYTGGLLNVNLKPVHYKGNLIAGPISNGSYNTSGYATVLYGGNLFFYGLILGGGFYSIYALKLDMTTGVVSESEFSFPSSAYEIYLPFRVNNNMVYIDWRHLADDYTATFNMDTFIWTNTGRTALGSPTTNSETIGGNIFQSLLYGLPTNMDTAFNSWHSGFYIS